MQAERICHKRSRGESSIALQDRRTRSTVDRVLRARKKMMKNNANEPADCMVIEMLQCLPMEIVFEVTSVREKVQKRMLGSRGVEKFSPWYFSRSQRPSLRKGYVDSARSQC